MKRSTKAQAHAAKMAELHAAADKIIAAGICPDCGGKLRRNLSILGWWQCEQLGAVGFRKDAERPSCSYQIFGSN